MRLRPPALEWRAAQAAGLPAQRNKSLLEWGDDAGQLADAVDRSDW